MASAAHRLLITAFGHLWLYPLEKQEETSLRPKIGALHMSRKCLASSRQEREK
jgi:hypothetical protein